MTNPIKKYPTIGACGLDCGLCPRYYTQGPSRCPGCCGPDFFSKHPSCSFVTCCVKKKNLEVCADCNEFPCPKFGSEGENSYDSFITHRKTVFNLNFIKEKGIERFIEQQKKRIKLLETMLNDYDEGRSKSFYCLATALLSIESLEKSLNNVEKSDNIKIRAKNLKKILNEIGVELKLRKK